MGRDNTWKGGRSFPHVHQEFRSVPKMEGFLNFIAGYFGSGFSLT